MKPFATIALGVLVAGTVTAVAASSYGYGSDYDYGYDIVDDTVTLVDGHTRLTNTAGMTLYTFDNDAAGASNCYGDCAVNWPPYLAPTGAKSPGNGFSIIERQDGTRQWAKDGQPLYLWVGDTTPGDTTGDGVGGVWHIAR